jgi:hypothetical protein
MQTNTAPAATRPHQYLTRFDHWLDDVQLICWVDFERGDASVGLNPSAWLYHAYVGDSGMDIAELLSDDVIAKLEAAAAHALDDGRR